MDGKHILVMVSTAVVALWTGAAYAQDCGLFGRIGVYDISSSSSNTDRALSFRRLFCQQNYSTASKASSFGASLGIPVENIPVELGIDQSDEAFREDYARFCDDQAYQTQFREKTESFVAQINPKSSTDYAIV